MFNNKKKILKLKKKETEREGETPINSSQTKNYPIQLAKQRLTIVMKNQVSRC